MPKCDACGAEMKPLFSSMYCPDEGKPDHGKPDMEAAGNKFLRGQITADEFEKLWKKAFGRGFAN